MDNDDKAVALGFLLVVLGAVLLTTAAWRLGIAVLPSGVALAGYERLWEMLRGGFAEALGWTAEEDEVE